MQIAAHVPSMIASAALQFTVHLAQASLEASIRRDPGVNGKVHFLCETQFLVFFSRTLAPIWFSSCNLGDKCEM